MRRRKFVNDQKNDIVIATFFQSCINVVVFGGIRERYSSKTKGAPISSISTFYNKNSGEPQESTLRTLPFDIFTNYLFFSITESEVFNFSEDSTLYTVSLEIYVLVFKSKILILDMY